MYIYIHTHVYIYIYIQYYTVDVVCMHVILHQYISLCNNSYLPCNPSNNYVCTSNRFDTSICIAVLSESWARPKETHQF